MNKVLRKIVLIACYVALPGFYGCGEQVETPNRSGANSITEPHSISAKGGTGAARTQHKGKSYDTYTVDYPTEKIRFYWKDDQGRKLISLDNLKAHTEAKGLELLFGTNAGMYMEDFTPLGLYIERGKVLKRLNGVRSASGNFYLQPNGIFLLTASSARVVLTTEYKSIKEKVLYATQSGPMLVIDGQLHPAFTKGSNNLYVRSGVGINADGGVVFAISNTLTNYFDFATLFRDVLHCDHALYLDGAISRMYLPALQRHELGGEFGAMIGVTRPDSQSVSMK